MDASATDAEARRPACACAERPSLAILKQVQRLYEDRLAHIERLPSPRKLPLQVETLRAWVDDLVEQNTLLTKTVEELEIEATSRILLERHKDQEMACELQAEALALRRRLARKDSDLRGLIEVLRRLREFDYCTLEGIHFFEVTEADIFGSIEWRQKKLEEGDGRRSAVEPNPCKRNRHFAFERNTVDGWEKISELKIINDNLQKQNMAKDRELRRLSKDTMQYEQTITNLKKEMSQIGYKPRSTMMKDLATMTDVTCTCPENESSNENVRALRKVNVALSEEAHALRRVCAALDDQCRAAVQRAHFKDDIIREMRRQLKQSKTKLKEESNALSYHKTKKEGFLSGDRAGEYVSVSSASCGGGGGGGGAARPRRLSQRRRGVRAEVDLQLRDSDSDAQDIKFDGSGDDGHSTKSH